MGQERQRAMTLNTGGTAEGIKAQQKACGAKESKEIPGNMDLLATQMLPRNPTTGGRSTGSPNNTQTREIPSKRYIQSQIMQKMHEKVIHSNTRAPNEIMQKTNNCQKSTEQYRTSNTSID
jgi:hypothetical protein